MFNFDVVVQVVINGVLRSGLYILTAVGLALAVGVIGILNFAHGEFLMLGAFLGVFLFTACGLDPLLSLPLAAVLLFVLGALMYRSTISRVLKAPHINQLLLTFGISVFLQNLALILWGGDPRAINVSYRTATLSLGEISFGAGRGISFLVAVLLSVLLFLLLQRTRLGKAIRAVAQQRNAAGLVGIEVEHIYLIAFGFSTALAGMAGVMLSMILYAQPMVGLAFTLKAFCIVVMAGLGNVFGVVWAALTLGLAESVVGTLVPGGSGWADGIFFILILVFLSCKRGGFDR